MKKEGSVETIIQSLQRMLRDGTLKPGEKIPSERILAEQFKTTRGYVRKALQKLEFYGVVEIVPQKGIYMSMIRAVVLDALMTNVSNIDAFSLVDLIETRSHLEILSARLAAERGDEKDFERIQNAHKAFVDACKAGKPTLEEDHLFHLEIVRASKNTVLQSLLTLITPEIIAMNRDFKDDINVIYKKSLTEHDNILKNIIARNLEDTVKSMSYHMEQSRSRRIDD